MHVYIDTEVRDGCLFVVPRNDIFARAHTIIITNATTGPPGSNVVLAESRRIAYKYILYVLRVRRRPPPPWEGHTGELSSPRHDIPNKLPGRFVLLKTRGADMIYFNVGGTYVDDAKFVHEFLRAR